MARGLISEIRVSAAEVNLRVAFPMEHIPLFRLNVAGGGRNKHPSDG